MTAPIKRALLSVYNKSGIVEFASQLSELGIEIISTGGTSKALKAAGIAHQQVESITGSPEMLDGRVKTLHPKIHGGILGKRDKDAQEASQHEISWIDLVVVNFYPFAQTIKDKNITWQEAIEQIDIGGPTMVRAAAKNFAWVGVVIDPQDYSRIIDEIKHTNSLALETRRELAQKAFALTSDYDAVVQNYFAELNANSQTAPENLNLLLEKQSELRYGENPHQRAYAYQFQKESNSGILAAEQYQGKPLSYNNIMDAEAAWTCVNEFSDPTCVIVKHANPCGVATAINIEEAYKRAHAADPSAAFGGIIALNRPCNEDTAQAIASVFAEVILAPAYTASALAIFATKPNLRVLQMPTQNAHAWEMKFITGGMLLQEKDSHTIHTDNLKVVTVKQPSSLEKDAMLFAWRVIKHIKSNAILIAKNSTTLGVGAGQVARIDAVDIAIRKASNEIAGAVLASEAFFPFRDSIDRIAQTGISAIIQPGGSVRDEEVIAACNEHNIAMVFTGKRCFRH